MELYIISQDGSKIVKAQEIAIAPVIERNLEKTDDCEILINGRIYGIYKNTERALEIIDELKYKLLFGGTIITNKRDSEGRIVDTEYVKTDNIVYEMPKA